MKFPKIIKHRKTEVTIYGKTPAYPFYRIAYRVDGKRLLKSFRKYSDAKTEAERLVRDLAKGSPVAALNATEARDAINALERLQGYFASTGRRISLLGAVSEFTEASEKANGWDLRTAIDGFLKTVATVKRKDVSAAVEEFIENRKRLTASTNGKRPQLTKGYASLVASWLRSFAQTFPGTSVCDLTKDHLNLYMQKNSGHSAKSRNHYRGAVKMFLRWGAKRDYLSQTHRLFEADSMTVEAADLQDIEFFRPEELQSLLEAARSRPGYDPLVPVLVLGGLAGIRLEEILRLEWTEIWRIAGHAEIKASKAKTRSRRLVELCPAALAWLEPYRKSSGRIFYKHKDTFHTAFGELRDSLKIPPRRNGLRHSFCTYHFALYADENRTAAQAGNTPPIIHAHYKGLATRADAEKWFSVTPRVSEKIVALPSSAFAQRYGNR